MPKARPRYAGSNAVAAEACIQFARGGATHDDEVSALVGGDLSQDLVVHQRQQLRSVGFLPEVAARHDHALVGGVRHRPLRPRLRCAPLLPPLPDVSPPSPPVPAPEPSVELMVAAAAPLPPLVVSSGAPPSPSERLP